MRFVNKNFLIKEYAAMFSPWLLVMGIFLLTYVIYYFLSENFKYDKEEFSPNTKNRNTTELISSFNEAGSVRELQEKYIDLDSKKLVESLKKVKCEYAKEIGQKVTFNCDKIDSEGLNAITIPKEHVAGIKEKYKKVQINIFSYFDESNKNDLSKILRFYDSVADCVETKMCDRQRTVKFFSGHIISFVTWFCPYYEKRAIEYNAPDREDDDLVVFISKNKKFIPENVPSQNSSYFRCKAHKLIEKEFSNEG